jgi:2-hydroxy-6-oxo-6-(2'-aminophenyl)hexa-2,4-dienoate hydrolase
MPKIESCFLNVDGLSTHYVEAGDGPTLVLVHGGGAGADAWGNWKDCIPLYAQSFRVIAVDMIGFGKSEKPDPSVYNYGQAARNRHMIGFLEALDVAKVHLIGNSMGGATSLGVAMDRPDLLHKLVLMGSAGLAVDNPDPGAKKALGGYDFTEEGMRALMRVLAGPNYVIDNDLLRYRHQATLQPDTRRALEAIRDATKGEGLSYPESRIAAVKTPTLVVGGKADKVAVPARNYRFLELLENSWGFMLPHCGHWVMIESPQEFVAVTTSFLREDLFGAN